MLAAINGDDEAGEQAISSPDAARETEIVVHAEQRGAAETDRAGRRRGKVDASLIGRSTPASRSTSPCVYTRNLGAGLVQPIRDYAIGDLHPTRRDRLSRGARSDAWLAYMTGCRARSELDPRRCRCRRHGSPRWARSVAVPQPYDPPSTVVGRLRARRGRTRPVAARRGARARRGTGELHAWRRWPAPARRRAELAGDTAEIGGERPTRRRARALVARSNGVGRAAPLAPPRRHRRRDPLDAVAEP